MVEVRDEEEHAYFAGYRKSRAIRTWRERLWALEAAGFLKVAPKGIRDIGYVLLIHPALIVARLRREGKIEDRWWHLYLQRQREVGAEALKEEAPAGTDAS